MFIVGGAATVIGTIKFLIKIAAIIAIAIIAIKGIKYLNGPKNESKAVTTAKHKEQLMILNRSYTIRRTDYQSFLFF